MNRRLRAQDAPHGVGATGLSVLGRLRRDGASTPTALAALERIHVQSLTRVLRALEDGGFVSRAADPNDRRRAMIAITRSGIAALGTSVRARESWLAATLDATLSPIERDLLRMTTALLERLADAGE